MFTRFALIEVASIFAGGAIVAGTCFAAGAPVGGGLALLVAGSLLAFYRDPPRACPSGDNILVAPADGRIVRVERVWRESDSDEPSWRIVIFLSVADVHVNRSPCAGRVEQIRYEPGKFLNALSDAATRQNERNTLTIRPRFPLPGPLHVRQIAGFLARRIVCAARPGDDLTLGQRFGMIKLGSQTELRGPEHPNWRLHARVGDVVRGGVTILASWHENPPLEFRRSK